MTYTINGKQYTEFDINKRCAELMGFLVQTSHEGKLGFNKEFQKDYPHTVWCAKVDSLGRFNSAWEQMVFTRCPADTDSIIDKCWDELIGLVYLEEGAVLPKRNGERCRTSKWHQIMNKHNCTKLVAACICLIEMQEGI
jgi:hypothetical protein